MGSVALEQDWAWRSGLEFLLGEVWELGLYEYVRLVIA